MLLSILGLASFQSIGVTKDWRHYYFNTATSSSTGGFPINRRHQGLATGDQIQVAIDLPHWKFPISRRHQALAMRHPLGAWRQRRIYGFQLIGVTKVWRHQNGKCWDIRIDGSFQSIGVTKDCRPWEHRLSWFAGCAGRLSINRRHQRLATARARSLMGLTVWFLINSRHQGLATTPTPATSMTYADDRKFPINRRHQGLATGKNAIASCMYLFSFNQ